MSWDHDTFILDVMRDPDQPFDPHPDLTRLRSERPVLQVRGWLPDGSAQTMWMLTRYDDVRAALASPDTSNARAMIGDAQPGYFVFADPPDHTRLRGLLTSHFTAGPIARLRPRVEQIVDEALDDLEKAGAAADLVDTFAAPVPARVICEMLGVPFADRREFERCSRDLMSSPDPGRRSAAMTWMRDYLLDLVTRHRADPGDDLLSTLLRDNGPEVTDDELAGVGSLLLTAGHATTTAMLASATLLLLRHPDQLALVRDDPAAVAPAVEELLRFLTVESGGVPRVVTRDITVGGQLIRAGELIRVVLPTANRDERLADAPDTFDVTRTPARHLSFGHGIHRCLGAPLARLELSVALPALLRRFPDLRLADPADPIPITNAAVRRLTVAW